MRSLALVSMCVLLAGCHTDASRRPAIPATDASAEAAPGGAAGHREATGSLGRQPGAGVPHASFIDQVLLAPGGDAALTRDQMGGWRLWAALDGSAQPQLIEPRGSRDGAIARDESGSGIAALIDSAGKLSVVRFDRRGASTPLAVRTEPGRRTLDVAVMPGGQRLVVLHADHSLELIGPDGQSLGTTSKRGFRPSLLLPSQSKDEIVAIAVEPGNPTHAVEIHRIAVRSEASASRRPALAVRGEPIRLTAAAALGPGQASINPQGNRVSFLTVLPGQKWLIVVVDLTTGKNHREVLPFEAHERVLAGFVDSDTLIVSSLHSGQTWRIETERRNQLFAHLGPGNQFSGQAAAAFASGVRLMAYGTWLYVETIGRDRLYLGYPWFEPLFGSLSPNNRRAAFVSNGEGVYVTALDGSEMRSHHLAQESPGHSFNRALFVDQNLLAIGDSFGGLRVIDWDSGEVVQTFDLGAGFHDIELDAERGLLRILAANRTWLFPVTGKGLGEPFAVSDGSIRSGFLAPGSKHDLWTLDASNIYRTYAIGELRRGLSREQFENTGTRVEHPTPAAIDGKGRFYHQQFQHNRMVLRRFDSAKVKPGDSGQVLDSSSSQHLTVVPSPVGDYVAVRRNDGVVLVYGDGEQALWSRSMAGHLYGVTFSPDGDQVVLFGQTGALVVEAATGDIMRAECGPQFEVRRTAPANAFRVAQRPSVCESL